MSFALVKSIWIRSVVHLDQMGRLGTPLRLLVEGLELLRECPWSTKTMEDQHGSMAVTHRHHPDLAGATLACRSFIHSLRALVSEAPADPELKRRLAAIERLDRKKPRRATGRQALVADVLWHMRQQHGHHVVSGFGDMQSVIAKCSQYWQGLPQ